MSAASHAPVSFRAPELSQADIESFHATHFSHHAISFFESQFLRPGLAHNSDTHYENYDEDEEEDDGLGYYSDGVKRTLTDEQIAIFRHSELEALRRAEARALKPDTADHLAPSTDPTCGEAVHTPAENETSLANSDAMDDAAEGNAKKKWRARQRRKENQKFQPEKKPDLRKRTWDIVEAGMDSLHYDDLEAAQDNGSASTTQRKQISYDD
ncbi:hypothetical protein GQX73_g6109 [Xylaria multiplex]|uniref:Uncharacterized protein n=1 Tax=Xylaria multiplex TaxID=323545 RepID=A0A7C8MTA9_9PEZI|nr:hypothetical protein GQX73_g6109 [Xylaria multiplex]